MIPSRFIDPVVLAGIKNLQLVAKVVVDGFLLGVHQSRRPGAGIEVSQHRSSQPGDDIRRLDWKMYARSDRFYIRESEVERSVTVRLLLDASASMAHQDVGVTKFDYACFLMASLAYLADRQGDLLGAHAVLDGSIVDLTPGRQPQQFRALVRALEQLLPSGVWPEAGQLESRIASTRNREIVVFLTDLHERAEEIRSVATKLRALKHEVLVLHLMARNELDFPYEGAVAFEDLETGAIVEGRAESLREAYLGRLRGELRSLKHDLHTRGVAYELLPTDQPLDQALKSFLLRRQELP